MFFQSEGFTRDVTDPAGEKPAGLAVRSVLKSHGGGVFALTGIYCAVAKELGLPVWPVVSPYHAFARYDDGAERVNVEMTQAGGHFDDAVYQEGYVLRIPAAALLKSQGCGPLLAAMLGSIASAANGAAEPDLAAALSKRAMELEPTCFQAMLVSARIDQAAGRWGEATATLQRLARTSARLRRAARHVGRPPPLCRRHAGGDRSYQAAIRTRIKPFGLAEGFDAEVWCRIAEIHADRYEQARRAGDPAWASHLNRCSAALMECLRLNPGHPRARDVLVRIGGRTVACLRPDRRRASGKLRNDHLASAGHGRLVGADAGGGPVGGRDGVDPGPPLLDDTADELVHEVRVRAVVPAALLEGQVRSSWPYTNRLVNRPISGGNRSAGPAARALVAALRPVSRQRPGSPRNSIGVLALHLPLVAGVLAVDREALHVRPAQWNKERVTSAAEARRLQLENRRLDGIGIAVLLAQFLAHRAGSEAMHLRGPRVGQGQQRRHGVRGVPHRRQPGPVGGQHSMSW